MKTNLPCPICAQPITVKLSEVAYCEKCNTSHEITYEIEDIVTGECTITFTGKSWYGKP